MGSPVEIKALVTESPDSHRIDVLTNWTLAAGKVADIINVKDDLENNRVNVNFDIIDGAPQQVRKLTTIRIQNPVSALDVDHKIFVYAYETEVLQGQSDMDTGNAHGN